MHKLGWFKYHLSLIVVMLEARVSAIKEGVEPGSRQALFDKIMAQDDNHPHRDKIPKINPFWKLERLMDIIENNARGIKNVRPSKRNLRAQARREEVGGSDNQ